MRRLLFRIAVPVLLILILITAGAIVLKIRPELFPNLSFPSFGFNAGTLFGKPVVRISSETLLEEIRAVYRANTVEYIYKTVFPYDFYPENIDESLIERKLKNGRYDARVLLTAAEQEYLETRTLADELGLNTIKANPGFLIVTAIVHGGFDLSSVGETRPVDPVFFSEEYEGKRTAFVRLPDPAITEVIIEDPASGEYPYPDIAITPARWKAVSGFIAERVRPRVINEGILLDAEAQGRRFITMFLEQAGFDDVIFLED